MTARDAVSAAVLEGYQLGTEHAARVVDTIVDSPALADLPVTVALDAAAGLIRRQAAEFVAARSGRAS